MQITKLPARYAYGYVPLQSLPFEEPLTISGRTRKEHQEKYTFNKYPIAKRKKLTQA